MAELKLRQGLIFGLGNPLLDISCVVNVEFLKKWGLEANNAILADDSHNGLVDDLVKNYDAKYIAGGAVQNTMRVVQWIVGIPKVCTFMGCIGIDEFGRCMETKATEDGVNCVYMKDQSAKTGHCAVMITDNGKNRSLCAFLGAANNFKQHHLEKYWDNVENARYFYISGFAITVSIESLLKVADYASTFNDRYFCFNLSAAFISQVFLDRLMQVFPFVDVLFGNETEAEAFAVANKFQDTKNMSQIAKCIANLPKKNQNKPRLVIITQGSEPVIIARQNEEAVQTFPVKKLDAEKIVDTNGAGDAFVAGYLSQYVQQKSTEQCVRVGIYAAQQIIQQDSCSIPKYAPQIENNN
ncbi:adenosine kinase-like protein [Leptotrombidium deliense]|uniref:Adenosine kinase n=1 Tax=Leptotrombidium deliense TaxID=299467 RepID=A0A443SSX7_9ACAR|nr:adenosine kinase-like protein [Leptotrombidium deliense]